jgi:hypothetical protein
VYPAARLLLAAAALLPLGCRFPGERPPPAPVPGEAWIGAQVQNASPSAQRMTIRLRSVAGGPVREVFTRTPVPPPRNRRAGSADPRSLLTRTTSLPPGRYRADYEVGGTDGTMQIELSAETRNYLVLRTDGRTVSFAIRDAPLTAD